MPLPPPPTTDSQGSFAWLEWFRQLRNYITQAGSVPWSIINFTGSTLSSIASRSHQVLQALQGGTAGEYYHVTNSKYNELVNNLDLSGTSGTGMKVGTSPTYGWRDLEGPIQPKASGAGSPTWKTWSGNIKEWAFIVNDITDSKFHWPHDWVPGTDVYLHIHWSHNGTAISGTFSVDNRYKWGKGHKQQVYDAEKTITVSEVVTNIAGHPALETFITEVQLSAASPSASQINTAQLEADGLLKMSSKVTSIPTVTGGDLFIEYIDIHYQSNNLGTKNKAPAFFA